MNAPQCRPLAHCTTLKYSTLHTPYVRFWSSPRKLIGLSGSNLFTPKIWHLRTNIKPPSIAVAQVLLVGVVVLAHRGPGRHALHLRLRLHPGLHRRRLRRRQVSSVGFTQPWPWFYNMSYSFFQLPQVHLPKREPRARRLPHVPRHGRRRRRVSENRSLPPSAVIRSDFSKGC